MNANRRKNDKAINSTEKAFTKVYREGNNFKLVFMYAINKCRSLGGSKT
jgi:hypothetical protein